MNKIYDWSPLPLCHFFSRYSVRPKMRRRVKEKLPLTTRTKRESTACKVLTRWPPCRRLASPPERGHVIGSNGIGPDWTLSTANWTHCPINGSACLSRSRARPISGDGKSRGKGGKRQGKYIPRKTWMPIVSNNVKLRNGAVKEKETLSPSLHYVGPM